MRKRWRCPWCGLGAGYVRDVLTPELGVSYRCRACMRIVNVRGSRVRVLPRLDRPDG
jgi:hypothetical protein